VLKVLFWRRTITEYGADSLGGLGERGLIAALAAMFPASPLASVGIGDDSAVLAAPSGSVVVAVDLLLEGRHFLRSLSSGYDVGVKAAARSLADIAAMGAVPTALLVALAAPGSLPSRWALDLASGLGYEAGRAGAGVIGGDTARADTVLVSVTALGDLAGRPAVLRSGARAGDVVAVAGSPGHSAAGYALLTEGVTSFPSLAAVHLRPAPPYDAGPEAASLGATAMIDTSDGLVADLRHVAGASGVVIDIATSSLVALRGEPLAGAASSLFSRTGSGDSPESLTLDWVLTGGEDHALAATFPPGTVLPPHWHVIGAARPVPADSPGGTVTIDGEHHQGPGGWTHFR
jgi:thiamine-monophosphate kinase